MAKRKLTPTEIEKRNLAVARELLVLCDEKRAEDAIALDMRGVCNFADIFLIATANSGPQIKGLVRDIELAMRSRRIKQLNRSGLTEGGWVVLDFGEIVVHLLTPEQRHFYRLEELWGDAPEIAAAPAAEGDS